jgi:hypothetical protein
MVADPHTIKGRAVLHEIDKVYVFAASRPRWVVNTLREKQLLPLLGREGIRQQLLWILQFVAYGKQKAAVA